MKQKIIVVTLLVLIMLSALPVFAAEDLSLEKAVKKAVLQNRQLENARHEISSAEKDIDLTIRSYYPTVDLKTSFTKLDEGQSTINPKAIIAGDDSSLIMETPDENYSTSLTLTQPIWLGGKVSLNKKIATYALEITKANYEQQEEETIFNVIQAYYGVLQAEGMVDIRKEALDIINDHLNLVQKNLKAGLVIKQDLLQTKIEKHKAEEELTAAENDLTIAHKRMVQLLAERKEYNLTQPENVPAGELQENKLFSTALENRSELLAMELNKKLIETRKELNANPYRPQISLKGSYEWEDDEFLGDDGWSVTLGGSIPLYDAGKAGIEGEKEDLALEKNQNSQKELIESIRIDIKDSVLSVEQAHEMMELEKLSLENASENLALANKSYIAGVGTNTGVTDAQANYRQAQISLLQAEYSYEIELFRTLYRTGQLSEYFKEVI